MSIKTFSGKKTLRRHADLVGIDFGTTETKVVRLKQAGDQVSLAGIELMPPVDFNSPSTRFLLPRALTAHYCCLCYSCPEAIVRVVNTPLNGEEETLDDEQLYTLLNAGKEYRPSARLINRGKGRQDSSFLAAAVPQDDVAFLLNMFPAGPPAPKSLEVSGLATITAFMHSRGEQAAQEAVCLVDSGETSSSFVFMNKGMVLLTGKADFGGRQLRARLADDLGVDEDLARSILSDRSINISSSLETVLGSFAKQISISKDFIERHQGCRLGKIHVSGGMSLLPSWVDEMTRMLQADVVAWNPLERIQCDASVLSPEIEGQIARFSAAIGAALGGFEEQ